MQVAAITDHKTYPIGKRYPPLRAEDGAGMWDVCAFRPLLPPIPVSKLDEDT